MYVCMYIYIYIHTHIHAYICMYVNMNITNSCVYIYIYTSPADPRSWSRGSPACSMAALAPTAISEMLKFVLSTSSKESIRCLATTSTYINDSSLHPWVRGLVDSRAAVMRRGRSPRTAD